MKTKARYTLLVAAALFCFDSLQIERNARSKVASLIWLRLLTSAHIASGGLRLRDVLTRKSRVLYVEQVALSLL